MIGPLNPLRLRTQLVLVFLIQVGLLFAVAGVYIEWQLQRVVERELGERLLTVAKMAAAAAADIPVVNLSPGEASSRTALYLKREMTKFVQSGDLSRLLIANPNGKIYFDSRGEIGIGQEYIRLRLDATEVNRALNGKPAAAPFFYDSENSPFKVAYAPILQAGQPIAILCVEGNAQSLNAIRETRRILLTIGLMAIAGAAVLAGFLSRQITRPLEKLKKAAEAIGRGNYEVSIEKSGSNEIVFLAQTLEDMRQAILLRQNRQQMMLAGIAHEIRNPLGGIELFASLLQKQCSPELQSNVSKIVDEVQHLKQIVNDFLDYARPGKPRRQPVDLHKAIDEAIEILGKLAEPIQWDLQINNDTMVYADADHLRRILLNLLRNSCEALNGTRDGKICIRSAISNQSVEIKIEDNGPGIADEITDKIFEPFFTARHQGTGLGLALVKQLVEANGGRVRLAKNLSGCTFQFTLPRFKDH